MPQHPRARAMRILGAAMLASVVLVACGGSGNKTAARPSVTQQPATTTVGTGAPNTTGTKDPCSYASVADVQSATGKTVSGDAIRINDFVCRYQTSGGVVTVGVATPVTKDRFEQGVQANAGGQALAMIDGLGEGAFAIPFGVSVFKGATSISVTVSPSPTPTGGDAAIALARLILQRI